MSDTFWTRYRFILEVFVLHSEIKREGSQSPSNWQREN